MPSFRIRSVPFIPRGNYINQSANYVEYLQCNRELKKLGNGLYSTVFQLGFDRVLKVGEDLGGWPVYIQWADKHGLCGTIAPRVFSIKLYPTFYTATMERLYTSGEMNNIGCGYMPHDYNTVSEISEARDGLFDQVTPYWKPLAIAQHIDPLYFNDVSINNILRRKNGDVVLVDPIARRWPER